VTYRVGINPYGVAIADINGDGKPDIAVADKGKDMGGGASHVSILLANGDGTYQPQSLYKTNNSHGMSEIILKDLNNDKKPDIVSFGDINTVRYLLNNGDGSFQDFDGSHFLEFNQIAYPSDTAYKCKDLTPYSATVGERKST